MTYNTSYVAVHVVTVHYELLVTTLPGPLKSTINFIVVLPDDNPRLSEHVVIKLKYSLVLVLFIGCFNHCKTQRDVSNQDYIRS